MATNKAGMSNGADRSGGSLASTLLAILAGGIAGGAMLLAGAKALGEKIEEIQVDEYERIEKQREEDKELANLITAIGDGTYFEPVDEDLED